MNATEPTNPFAELAGLHPYGLAYRAECSDPNGGDSIGAGFLAEVRDEVAERLGAAREEGETWRDDHDMATDMAASIADDVAYRYQSRGYREVWGAFVDLGAWGEDVAELGAGTADMYRQAVTALYMIAERLANTLAEEYGPNILAGAEECPECGEASFPGRVLRLGDTCADCGHVMSDGDA